ncbi:MAG: DNA polymerase III subunit alpha [Candidatus Pacebacteria bacterium]|nr:DNA polymerase III subunit alpha [Candidatus Paceibacterota bacterium]
MKFTHLHVHSHYSLLDGLPKIDELLDYVKELEMDSVALTDHGTIYGAVEFYKKAKAKGIKPIIGAEVYIAFEGMNQRRPNIDDKRYHLVLLVKNEKGYKNLVKLITKAHLEGFYYKPRIDNELLSQYSEGLIGLSACIQGKIPRLILSKEMEEAEKLAKRYQDIFGKDSFYLELQHHPNSNEQKTVNEGLISISKKYDIPLVATNDSHYLKKEDAEAQDILMLINTGASPNDPERLTLKTDDFSLRKPEEMIEAFKDIPEAVENTRRIKDMCNFEFELGKNKLPYYQVPDGKTPDEYLKELCLEGLKKRYKDKTDEEILKRLEYELKVIKETGFASYFLIVSDFVNWAKENRIIVGPGRGSVGGSLVAYLINITNIDPIKHGLLFERFLNPERVSMPDIDLDFTDRRRDEVIKYVAQKYGENHVAQIITFGTMASRAVIRDVGRALGYAYGYCDQMAKMVPFGFSLDESLKKVSDFKEAYFSDEKAKKLIDLAKKLEGVARHASTHACGVVISAEPLTDLVPLQHPTQDDGSIVTQYEMHAIEDLGLLKMDFLGLKNLTIIEDTLARIYVLKNEKIDIENIPFDDEKTYRLFQGANTTGVFQLESDGMKKYLKLLKPTCFEDITAMVALYRPGPIQFIPDYIARKQKKKAIQYLHPKLKPILEETQGICIYQEQLMKIAQEIAGFTLAEADILRKAVGKKIKELLHAQEQKFVNGADQNGVGKQIAEKLWQWILPFASYGFNKCLSGEAEIINAENGKLIKIKELFRNKSLIKETFSLDENNKIKSSKISGVFSNGIKPTFEVKTKSGRKITATSNHPFFTPRGWRNLEELKNGQVIAVPRIIPEPQKKVLIEDYKLSILGYLLAEGNFCHPHGFYFYSKSEEEIKDYCRNLEKFKNTTFTIDSSKSAKAVYSKRKSIKEKSEAVEWINSLGLRYKKAVEKFFPDFIFQLSNEQLKHLIGKMFQGNGCINFKNKCPQIFYAASSYQIAKCLQHLLLRFGIISILHTKKFRYREMIKIGYTVNISRYDNIYKFINSFSSYLLAGKRKVLEEIRQNHPVLNGRIKSWSARGSIDIIPVEIVTPFIRSAVSQKCLSFKEGAKENSFSERLFYNNYKIGYLRETVQHISQSLNIKDLETLSNSDIFWDKISSISYIKNEETFDLTIDKTHNFIANDIFVHNSHSSAYAMIAYQTAYLKAHYPVEFMASLLTSEKTDVERIAVLIEEARKMRIEVLAPDINESLKNFTVVPKENKIRFGLLAVKNVGENIIDVITAERKANGPFKSITDFITRINCKDLNKKSMESLIKAGAFDKLGERNQLLQNLEKLLEYARENHKVKINGQKGLFENTSSNYELSLSPAASAGNLEKLGWEKELLGLYVTSHPLEDYRSVLEDKTFSLSKITGAFLNKKVKIGGIISSIKKIITKSGRPMLFLKIEDLTDKAEVVVFPPVIEKNPSAFCENKIVFIKGRVDNRNNEPKIIAEEIEEIITN